MLGLLLFISQPAVGHDDDEDDNGFQSEGGTCTKTCTLAALRPLASDTYINKGPVRSFEDVCSTTTVTTAQVNQQTLTPCAGPLLLGDGGRWEWERLRGMVPR